MAKIKKLSRKGRARLLDRKQDRARSLVRDPGKEREFNPRKLTAKRTRKIAGRLDQRTDRRLDRLGFDNPREFRQGLKKADKPKGEFIRDRKRKVARREMMNDPNWALNPLTRRDAGREAKQMANLEFRPAIRQVNREIKGSLGQHRAIDTAYDLYGQKLAEIAGRTQEAYQNFQQQAYQQANQDTAQVQQGAVPGSELSQQVQNAAAVRNANTVNFGGMIGAQGAAQTAFRNDQDRIAGLERLGAHSKEQAFRRDLKQEKRGLKQDRGARRGEHLSAARENERRWTLEQIAFELDKFQAEQDAKNAKHDRRRERREFRQEKRETARDDRREDRRLRNDIQDDRADNQRSDSGGSDDGATPTQERNNRQEWREIVALVRSKPPRSPEAVRQAQKSLVGRGHDPLLAKAAIQRVTRGHVSPSVARRLRKEFPGVSPRTRRPKGFDSPLGHNPAPQAPGPNGESRPG